MFNNVGLKSTKGTGLSGFIEHSKATVRNAGTASGFSATRPAPPSQRSRRETPEAKAKLEEHNALRAIKLECAELDERLSVELNSDFSRKWTAEEVHRMVANLAQQRHTEYKAQKEARRAERKAERQSEVAAAKPSDGKTADRFAAAFDLAARRPGDEGSAFDQEAKKAAKAQRRVGRWQQMEKKAEEKVLAKLMAEQQKHSALAEDQDGGGDGQPVARKARKE